MSPVAGLGMVNTVEAVSVEPVTLAVRWKEFREGFFVVSTLFVMVKKSVQLLSEHVQTSFE